MTRNDLIEILVDVLKDSKYDSSIFDTAYRAVNAIGDVQPVIHAKWIDECPYLDIIHSMYSCSNCNEIVDYPTNYCAKCGAKMD